jgi:hypothetical protein
MDTAADTLAGAARAAGPALPPADQRGSKLEGEGLPAETRSAHQQQRRRERSGGVQLETAGKQALNAEPAGRFERGGRPRKLARAHGMRSPTAATARAWTSSAVPRASTSTTL